MNPQQIADEIISEENIDNTNLATEEPVTTEGGADDVQAASDTAADDASDKDPEEPAEDAAEEGDKPAGEEDKDKGDEADKPVEKTPEPTPVVEPDGKTPTETVKEAQTLLGTLQLTEDKVFTADGEVVPFEDVVPAGAYLAAQLEPVSVTDKDGKTHEFLLISDVEKAFPNGFEAKNNIEQMKFERAIVNNEEKFDKAVKSYENAKTQYTQETNAMVQQRSDNERIRSEYLSMASQGLVPKVEGDPSDPKFLDQPAVKELNKLLEWQEAKNKELKTQGLGQINSLWVAKQIMDSEGSTVKTSKDKEAIINERKEVASLTSSGTPTKDTAKQVHRDVPMSRLADEIIASEGLK